MVVTRKYTEEFSKEFTLAQLCGAGVDEIEIYLGASRPTIGNYLRSAKASGDPLLDLYIDSNPTRNRYANLGHLISSEINPEDTSDSGLVNDSQIDKGITKKILIEPLIEEVGLETGLYIQESIMDNYQTFCHSIAGIRSGHEGLIEEILNENIGNEYKNPSGDGGKYSIKQVEQETKEQIARKIRDGHLHMTDFKRNSIDSILSSSSSSREQDVLSQRYGLVNNSEPQVLEDIARNLGLSREKTRQIESSAMNKVRNAYGPDFFKKLAGFSTDEEIRKYQHDIELGRAMDKGRNTAIQEMIAMGESEQYLMPINDLDLPVNTSNSLQGANISTLKDLCSRTREQLLNTPGFGRKDLHELEKELKKKAAQ